MNLGLTDYLRSKRIDTFQKLNFLLFLHEHPHVKGTSQEFAERLYIGDTILLKKILLDLELAGLVEQIGNRYQLRGDSTTKSYLNSLAGTFADPLARQELLDQVQRQSQLITRLM